jgi:hypothetical protein
MITDGGIFRQWCCRSFGAICLEKAPQAVIIFDTPCRMRLGGWTGGFLELGVLLDHRRNNA